MSLRARVEGEGAAKPPNRVQLGVKNYFLVTPLREVGELGGGRYKIWFAESLGVRGRGYVGTMVAFDAGAQKYVGAMHLYETSFGEKEGGLDRASACAFDLKSLSVAHGTHGVKCLVVSWAKVRDEARGAGIGTALYLAAAAHARKLNMALCADACSSEGTTSAEARRVWRGKTFLAAVDAGKESGLVGVYRRSI